MTEPNLSLHGLKKSLRLKLKAAPNMRHSLCDKQRKWVFAMYSYYYGFGYLNNYIHK